MTRLIVAGPEEAHAHALAGHPERPERVRAAMAGVDALDLLEDQIVVSGREATVAELARVHTPDYLHRLEDAHPARAGMLDADTFVSAGSWLAARRAAGAGLAAVDGLRRGLADVAFVVARPPGHHALADRAMGFCLLNNVAVAAAALEASGERVLIVDWDVHHGNGTQEIFWDDDHVLYVSTHQAPLYPGTGAVGEVGGPNALGLTVNLPLPAGATGDVLRRALDDVAAPVIARFAPTWVLVSAGFDAHRADPMADLALSAGDFADLARTVAGFVPGPGHLALFLEGGYDVAALQASVTATLAAVLGVEHRTEAPTSGGPGAEALYRARRIHAEPREHELW